MPLIGLVFGDTHFQDSNILQVDEFIAKSVELAQKVDPTFIVVLGDVLHTCEKAYVTPYNRALRWIRELSNVAPTYVLIGNHDYKNASQYLTDEHFFNALKVWPNVFIVDDVLVHQYDLVRDETSTPLRFAFTPYVPLTPEREGRFIETLSKEMWESCECVFAHQEIRGCLMGGKISESPDEWDENYPLLVSGHIHEHQILGNVFYTGSSIHTSLSPEEKYAFEFHFNGAGEWEVKKHDLDLIRKKLVRIAVEDTEAYVIDAKTNELLTLEVFGTSDLIKRFKNSKKYRDLSKDVAIRFDVVAPEVESVTTPDGEITIPESRKNRSFVEVLGGLIDGESDIVKGEYSRILAEANT